MLPETQQSVTSALMLKLSAAFRALRIASPTDGPFLLEFRAQESWTECPAGEQTAYLPSPRHHHLLIGTALKLK